MPCSDCSPDSLSLLQPCIIRIEDMFDSPDALYIVLELYVEDKMVSVGVALPGMFLRQGRGRGTV